ncbi:hypothetical protein ACQP2Y_37385 [Actinoplanes sp. CA-051413]|uniref:hypothetical protein n=1 Tax=Actinoplanes sp. CA-051413 TaxID=3239899 RepID=UPI003D96315D
MSDLRTDESLTTGTQARRPVTAAVGGAFILVCAVAIAGAVAATDHVLTPDGPARRLDYPAATWPLLLALAVAGVTVMAHHRWARAAALLAAIVAAQLVGIGLIAIRAWFTIKGFGGSGSLTETHITYAAAAALVAAAATASAAALVWREPVDGWRSLVPARPMLVAAGVAVLGLLPQLWNAADETGDITGLAQIATLTYSLPWGVGLVVAGWIRGRSAVAVTVSTLLFAMFMVATNMLGYYSTYPLGD